MNPNHKSSTSFIQESREKVKSISLKLRRLLDGYLEQDIKREIYLTEKAKLLSEKKSLDEKMARIEQKQTDWFKPFQNWIKVASTLVKIARDNDLLQKKVIAKEIFLSETTEPPRRLLVPLAVPQKSFIRIF